MCQVSSVLQQQIKELEAMLGSGRMHCVEGKEVGTRGCSWHELCPGPEGARPDSAMLRSGGEGMVTHPAHHLTAWGPPGRLLSVPWLPPSFLGSSVCLSCGVGPWVPKTLTLPHRSNGGRKLHGPAHNSAGGFDEKVKNINQTISFSSYSESSNNDLSHMGNNGFESCGKAHPPLAFNSS